MRLVYVVVVRNQASVNKVNNYLITFNVLQFEVIVYTTT